MTPYPNVTIIAKKGVIGIKGKEGVMYSSLMAKRKEHRSQIAEARNVLGQVISRARYAGETTVLINRGAEAAVVVPFDFYVRACEALGEERVSADSAES